MKGNVPEVLRKHFDNVLILDAWIQWASNPTSASAGYALEENYSMIRSNLMERYLISAEDAEQYVQTLRYETSSLTTLGYNIDDLRKGILEEARSSGIWTKNMKEKLQQSSPDARKAVYLLLYLVSQSYFRSYPDSDYESHSFEMDSWARFLMRFRAFYSAAYGLTFSKSIEEELFRVGLWNKLWYKPCRSPGKIEVVMVPLPMLDELDFNEADMTQKADVGQLIEQLFRDCLFEKLAFIDEVAKAPFGIRRFKQEVPSVEGIVAISGKDGYEVAISPFLLEHAKDLLNSHKQKMIHDYDEKIEKALAQMCDEKWPECECTCKAKGQQSLWQIDSASYSPFYVYLTPWLTEADLTTLFPDKDLSAIFFVLKQPIPAIKRTLSTKIAAFRYLEVLSPSGDGFQCWKATGERFGHIERTIELIESSLKSSNTKNELSNIVDSDSKQWDLFISHASEDKDEIVRPLVAALMKEGFVVWYDEFTLTVGDSLRKSIDKGLACSKYGVVVLSKNFFEKDWPQKELDGLDAREKEGRKVILPIWHKVDSEYIKKYSPMLAGRLGIPTSKGVPAIVDGIMKVVTPTDAKRARSIRDRMKSALDLASSMNKESITDFAKVQTYGKIEQMLTDLLAGIAYFDLYENKYNDTIFDFVEISILERPEEESKRLSEIFMEWFFQTVTPYKKDKLLSVFAELAKMPFFREIVARKKMVSSFVAEFGISGSYNDAAANAEILYDLQALLSEEDLEKIADFTSENTQIRDSWGAENYLKKLLGYVERRFGKEKTDEIRKRMKRA